MHPFLFMSAIADALDKAILPYRWIYEVHPPKVLSAWSFVAVVPRSAVFRSLLQYFHEYSEPELDRYLLVAFFSSCNLVRMAVAAVVASSFTRSFVFSTVERVDEKRFFLQTGKVYNLGI